MAGILSELFSLKYSIGDLMNIDKDRMQKSSEMTVNLTNVYHEIKKESIFEKFKKFFFRNKDVMNVYYVIFRFEVSSPSGSVYTVLIRTYPDFDIKNYLDNTVEIFCSCSDFQFRCTYGINAQINGNNELVLPTNNVVEPNRTLEFLNEDIFRGIITDSLYRSNSKKKDNR
jgi:hypothetical protein